MKVFLDAPQLFENLCAVARTLEVLGFAECLVHDPHRLVRPRYGKSRTRVAKAASAGAFHRIAFERIEDPGTYLTTFPGRVVATVAEGDATPIEDFAFLPDDVVVFGSESHGVSPEVLTIAESRVTISQRGKTNSLNLAVSVGIVLYEAIRQLGPSALPSRRPADPMEVARCSTPPSC